MQAEQPEDNALHLVHWPWPVVLLGHVPRPPDDSSSNPDGSLLFVSPTAQGLDALEISGHVLSSLWVVALVETDGIGAPLSWPVEEIRSLGAVTADARRLSVLRGPEGRFIAIEDDDMFVLDGVSGWKAPGQYKSASAASEG